MSERKSLFSRMYTIIIGVLIVMTSVLFLVPFFPTSLIIMFVSFALTAIYIGTIYSYLTGKRGYQDRYTRHGQEYQQMEGMMRLMFLLIVAVIFYFILSNVMREYNLGNPIYAMPITIIVTVAVVQFVDYYAGKDMEDYVDYKEKSHNRYVESLGKAEGKCMSCQRIISAEDKVCPHCGFTQRSLDNDHGYLSKSRKS